MFKELVGRKIISITGMETQSEEVYFTLCNGSIYKMYHDQDCCECVYLSDVCGDVDDILDSEVIHAEERSNSDIPEGESYYDSVTFTFYDIQTRKGSVNLRWVGESNGYYSEDVYFELVK